MEIPSIINIYNVVIPGIMNQMIPWNIFISAAQRQILSPSGSLHALQICHMRTTGTLTGLNPGPVINIFICQLGKSVPTSFVLYQSPGIVWKIQFALRTKCQCGTVPVHIRHSVIHRRIRYKNYQRFFYLLFGHRTVFGYIAHGIICSTMNTAVIRKITILGIKFRIPQSVQGSDATFRRHCPDRIYIKIIPVRFKGFHTEEMFSCLFHIPLVGSVRNIFSIISVSQQHNINSFSLLGCLQGV